MWISITILAVGLLISYNLGEVAVSISCLTKVVVKENRERAVEKETRARSLEAEANRFKQGLGV